MGPSTHFRIYVRDDGSAALGGGLKTGDPAWSGHRTGSRSDIVRSESN